MNFFSELRKSFINSLLKINPQINTDALVEISLTKDEQFGDFQTNIALKASKLFKLPPLVLADQILSHIMLKDIYDFIVAGPGFINIKIKNNILLKASLEVAAAGFDVSKTNRKIIVEYSSPNVAKELHVGHLRSTIIGDALANCFEWAGDEVLRLNHIGDWGTAFGMLISYIKRHSLDYRNSDLNLATLMIWYQESKIEFDADESIYEDSKREVVSLQSGDPQNIEIWTRLCEISEQGYKKIYDALDIKNLKVRGESFYNPYLAKVVEDFNQKNLLTYSDGAACVFMDGFKNRNNEPLPLIIQKADGGFNYATTDLASVWYRVSHDRADKIYYVTDNGQREHFAMFFEAARLVGYAESGQLVHVPFGVVQDEFKKRFKTRSGGVIKLQDLLDEAYERAYEIAKSRELNHPEEFAKIIGYGALKYADLSSNRIMDYVFDFDRMLSFEGNTVVYLMYSFVRACSILSKAEISLDNYKLNINDLSLNITLQPTERSLLKHCLLFPLTIESVLKNETPHVLCEYLYDLAVKFNHFFRDCPVLNAQEKAHRLAYVFLTANVLKQGLSLLGIKTINEM